jgi:hypothetical protein
MPPKFVYRAYGLKANGLQINQKNLGKHAAGKYTPTRKIGKEKSNSR